MSKIKEIRFCLTDNETQKTHKIFKLKLSLKEDNFYLLSKNGDVKISFHKSGTKYLRIKGLNDSVLYKDIHYDKSNLNPIFAFLPKRLNDYPILTKSEPGLALLKVELPSDDFDLAIILNRVNYMNDGVFINEAYKNKLNWEIEGQDLNGNIVKTERPICLLDFGDQKYLFEIIKISRKGLGFQNEHVILFKPGKEIEFYSYLKTLKFPNKNGDQPRVMKNTKEEIYLISF